MKISEMIQREDFYKINYETLGAYYGLINDKSQSTELYVYPKINAIITRKPSQSICKYLITEYAVRGNFIKKILAQIYVYLCLNSAGRLASRAICVNGQVDNGTLIYPCNKKYRIFDFKSNTVSVITKAGFNNTNLQHEVEFRSKDNLPSFVPKLYSIFSHGYTEKIIDGVPLARLKDNYSKYRDSAYEMLCVYAKESMVRISGTEYGQRLFRQIQVLTKNLDVDRSQAERITEKLYKIISKRQELEIAFSHGDLQPGNIWVENHTNKIYIIDWESWGIRSTWYDKATLYSGIRQGKLAVYAAETHDKIEVATVLLEDYVFQLQELINLPYNYGEKNYERYVATLEKIIKGGVCDERIF